MITQPVSKYHIAPNFSINPPEAGRVLELGSIVSSLASADEPLNEECHIRLPQAQLFCSHQNGFAATLSQMIKGEYGVWAKFVGIDGVGGELSWALERSAEDIYSFREIDTIYFNPSQKYMEDSMNQDDVKEYVAGSGYDPVYMVTGLKTARGPSVRMAKGRNWGVTVEFGLQQPGGLPVELGPKFNTSKEVRREMGFEDSTDFIMGIRVKKLAYKRHWLLRTPGVLVAKEHNKGATMVDDNFNGKQRPDEVIELVDETEVRAEMVWENEDGTIESDCVVGKD